MDGSKLSFRKIRISHICNQNKDQRIYLWVTLFSKLKNNDSDFKFAQIFTINSQRVEMYNAKKSTLKIDRITFNLNFSSKITKHAIIVKKELHLSQL
jgi:hypothetical protein